VKFKNVDRPFKSPFGIFGAFYVICVSIVLIVFKIGFSTIFQLTVVTFCIKMVLALVFYIFVTKKHLLPTEDAVSNILMGEGDS
jgi:hypothetical protein